MSRIGCRAAAAMLSILAAAAAQPERPAPERDGQIYDFVAAMVGDRAILASQVSEAWRGSMQSDAALPPEMRRLTTLSAQRTEWRRILDALIGEALQAQSLRLMGKSPDEIEAQVDRLAQDRVQELADSAGGLNAMAKQLGMIGQSMKSVYEEERNKVMQQMAAQQAILAEVRDQIALLVTPREMLQMFQRRREEFVVPARVVLRVGRFPRSPDDAAARRSAAELAASWRAIRPFSAEAAAALGSATLTTSVADRELFQRFAADARPGDVGDPVADEAYWWAMVCLEREEGQTLEFADLEVQRRLRAELVQIRVQEILERTFQESRVGVDRLPFGLPELLGR